MSRSDRADPHDQPTVIHAGTENGADVKSTLVTGAPSSMADTMPAVGRTFGDYELLDELGRGGMGVVYRARQRSLNRQVALKMILPGPLAAPEDLARFRTEAEAAGRLQHPNIVAIHEVGAAADIHYYSMDFIDGPSLAKILTQGPMPIHDAARHVMIVARAMHHAHGMGIVHRDLKPSNILVDAQGHPHVTDFGLAKKLGGDPGQTRTGSIMGTPSYMSPEQASGRIKDLGPATDIYSLGAVLYELITGQSMFPAETPVEALKCVLEREPYPPRLLNSKIDRDLETICLKCLQKDTKHRYATAAELADDLQRYLAGEPIHARSTSVLDRLTRTLDRSQHMAEFRDWESMLLVLAAIMFLGHFAMFVVSHLGLPTWTHWATRGAQFSLIGILFWHYRARTLLPTSAAERQLWSIWIAYLMAYGICVVVQRSLSPTQDWNDLSLYPLMAVLTGMAFFIMGSSYWGYCYVIGLWFFGLAVVMPLRLQWAPLGMGSAWTVTLFALGWHVRHLAPVAKPENRSDTSITP